MSHKEFSLDHYSVSEELKLSHGKNQMKNVKTLFPMDKKWEIVVITSVSVLKKDYTEMDNIVTNKQTYALFQEFKSSLKLYKT